MIILPGHPLFDLTLSTAPPPGSDGATFLVADSSSGLLRPASYEELTDYMEGGEYEERMYAIGDSADPEESAWLASQEIESNGIDLDDCSDA